MNRVIFLDKDGTIVDNSAYDVLRRTVGAAAKLNREAIPTNQLISGLDEGLRTLARTNYKIIIVSNQSHIARGVFTQEETEEIFEQLQRNVQAVGGRIDAWYYCPHDDIDACRCRKPLPGLLERAVREHGISLQGSFIIGDSPADINLGKRVGLTTALVRTGQGAHYFQNPKNPQPDYVFADLNEAARILFAR